MGLTTSAAICSQWDKIQWRHKPNVQHEMITNWGSSRTVRDAGPGDCLHCCVLANTVLLSQTLGHAGQSHPMGTARAQAGLWMLVSKEGSSLLLQKWLQHSAEVPAAFISLAVAWVQHRLAFLFNLSEVIWKVTLHLVWKWRAEGGFVIHSKAHYWS